MTDMTLPSRLRLYAQQWEDVHAPENVTRTLREAAAEIERLYRIVEETAPHRLEDRRPHRTGEDRC